MNRESGHGCGSGSGRAIVPSPASPRWLQSRFPAEHESLPDAPSRPAAHVGSSLDQMDSASETAQMPTPTGTPLPGSTPSGVHCIPRMPAEIESRAISRFLDTVPSDTKDPDLVREPFGGQPTSGTTGAGASFHMGRESGETGGPSRAGVSPSIGTPSTLSTAPSTDDASLGAEYKLDDPSLFPQMLNPILQQMQMMGEDGILQRVSAPESQSWLRYHGARTGTEHQRVASFRDVSEEASSHIHQGKYGMHRTSRGRSNDLWQSHPPPQKHTRIFPSEMQLPLTVDGMVPVESHGLPGTSGRDLHQSIPEKDIMVQQFLAQSLPSQVHTGTGRQQHSSNSYRHAPTLSSGAPRLQQALNPQRSSSEILKTLLRKKACLYEPDTSRSVALVTWLVGKELALEYGFFSRQQLQCGVHSCVARKIESGTITRTKVNRCMQIILNSCFHYIIPRSDGSEEKGDSFKASFAETVRDDSFLLRHLPFPWNDLVITRDAVIGATFGDVEGKQSRETISTPKSSPRLASIQADGSPTKDPSDGETGDFKRAVLLCFNENVRSAEDVFRCHNEFIRDTANASHLQLSAHEWRKFFGSEADRTPFLWSQSPGESNCQSDLQGQMSRDEASKFRTSWCMKRYDHDQDLCGFAHIDVNCGWLRRNPDTHDYNDEMCTFISTSQSTRISPNRFVVNECRKGVFCGNSHSLEEIWYHPNRYKSTVCTSRDSGSGACYMGDICPKFHQPELRRATERSQDKRSHSSRGSRRNEPSGTVAGVKSNVKIPSGSPSVYCGRAPFSSFERQLLMPGLQQLFRRQSAVVRADMRNPGCRKSFGNQFGDDWCIEDK